MALLKAVQSTVLKRDPNRQSTQLPDPDKYSLPAGTTLEITTSTPAANRHIQVTLRQPLKGFTVWYAFADHVQIVNDPTDPLDAAKNRQKIFEMFLATETQDGSNQDHLSFLDRGLNRSLFKGELDFYPNRLRQPLDTAKVVSLGPSLKLTGSSKTVTFSAYPKRGTTPTIDSTGLEFLHSDITEACICVGSLVDGQMRSHWIGRNALTDAQFWSATKIVPILNVICQANSKAIRTPISDCVLFDPSGTIDKISFTDAMIDIVSYRKDDIANNVFISNQTADTLKRFETMTHLEQWFEGLTGNQRMEFRGYYAGVPLINSPQLRTGSTTLLTAEPEGNVGENLVSAYDLTRIITMLAWHFHIPAEAKLPGAQWHSLETAVRSLGYDSARYLDVAIETLGLRDRIRNPVILSKLGFGPSDRRDRTEAVYTALVQFIDQRPEAQGKPAVLRSVGITLRAAMRKLDPAGKRDLDEEARWIDARMAAEVTEILRRIVTQELA